ncbi:hypothetical protein [Streptomyces sp. SID3343]|uniref:hypothetical protein n=1 Tax=Streptomyces sp. SID3343 TaxID=2690260 RepID=UPI00136C8E85|nr:hypothetical protein [Streptomyces sp. SID3343]MYV99242.1 hypothetical protein [Streptomyces sp. SID3343]
MSVSVSNRLRVVLSCLAIVLACVLAAPAVVAGWADNEVVDTGRFVSTLGPLSSDSSVQNAVADRVADAAVQAANVPGALDSLREALGLGPSEGAGPGSGVINGLLSTATHAAAQAVVSSDLFGTIWKDALRTAHRSALRALRGQDDSSVSTVNGDVVLDLGPIVDRVRAQLVGQGIPLADRIPNTTRTFVLLHGDGLSKSQDVFRLVDAAGTWLPIVVLVLIVIGVAIAPRRRRVLMWLGIGVVIAMVVLAIGLYVARRLYLDDLPADMSHAAAAAVYDTLVHVLRVAIWTTAIVAAVLALVTFLAGPARPAVALRGVFHRGDRAGRSVGTSG